MWLHELKQPPQVKTVWSYLSMYWLIVTRHYKLNCVPQNSHVEFEPPLPQNVIIFGDRVHKEELILNEVISVGLIQYGRYLYKQRAGQTTEGRPCKETRR